MIENLIEGIRCWRIWLLLGWQDIRLRYRRSIFGPFWLTISMAMTIYSMGFLYGGLFKVDLKDYFPFLAAGFLTWGFIVTTINETTIAFIEATDYLKQIKLPHVIFILRVITRNIIIFFHNIVAIIPIIIYFHVPIGWHTLSLFLGLGILIILGVIYGMVLAMLGARFRDIGQIVASVMQVIFFITPVMWSPKILPDRYSIFVKLNPFARFIDLVRAPLTGNWPTSLDYMVAGAFIIVGTILMLFIYKRAKHRIIYWL